jgi:hypothetical protein
MQLVTVANIKNINKSLVRRIPRALNDDWCFLGSPCYFTKIFVEVRDSNFSLVVENNSIKRTPPADFDINRSIVGRLRR